MASKLLKVEAQRPTIRQALSVGEVAARSGVTISTLHFYQAEGLISSWRNSGNQRRYAREVLRERYGEGSAKQPVESGHVGHLRRIPAAATARSSPPGSKISIPRQGRPSAILRHDGPAERQFDGEIRFAA